MSGATGRSRRDRHAERRARMVERDLAGRGIVDRAVLAAMGSIPRERFVGATLRRAAYRDTPLPIDEGQTISQPYIVALMAQAARLGPDDRVLEVGTGSGYGAAVLASIVSDVITIERHRTLANRAAAVLREVEEDLDLGHVTVVHGDGSAGHVDGAPYDAIIVTAAAPAPPPSLLAQLADGGRLVIPVGSPGGQDLVRVIRRGDSYEREDLGAVRFVPLIGSEGWDR